MDTQHLFSQRVRRFPPTAFTLLELLVVIAIMGMLMSLLLPSLESARRKSKQAVCLAHIKNLATSSKIYEADDPNGWGIPVHPLVYDQARDNPSFIGAYEWGGKSGIGAPGWVPGPQGDYAFLTSKYGRKAGFGPATRPMNKILYPGGFSDNLNPKFDRLAAADDTRLEVSLFRCPADDGPPRAVHCPDWIAHTERSSYNHFGTSYVANLFMISSKGGGPVRSNSPYMRPVSRVPTPSRTIYYEENIGRWAWACRREHIDWSKEFGEKGGVGPGPTKAVRGWHGEDWTFNRAFIDGHAETQAVIIPGTEDSQGYSRHYRTEVVFADSDKQEYYRFVTVRGPGWQKDTLPAAPIPTGLNWYGKGRVSFEGCVSSSND